MYRQQMTLLLRDCHTFDILKKNNTNFKEVYVPLCSINLIKVPKLLNFMDEHKIGSQGQAV